MVDIEGAHWKLTAQDLDVSDTEGVPFTYVSYIWGEGREYSPLHPSFNISDPIILALNAAIRIRPPCACVWIDVFCVPLDQSEKAFTFESMALIYSRADETIIVLSNAAHLVLEQMSTSDCIDPIHLDILEREEWVSRAWTYQEAVNSRTISLTCEGSHGALLQGSHFLNCLGYTLSRFNGSGLTNGKRQRYPRLEAFEDLIADYMIGAYQELSALQVISNMDRRTQRNRENHFYAMIDAISTARASSRQMTDPCEAFMLLCERKGDYSFSYSAAKRDSTASRRWHPVSGDLPSILPWHCFGDDQPAHEESDSISGPDVAVGELSHIRGWEEIYGMVACFE